MRDVFEAGEEHALYNVVANCETPPPTESSNRPSSIIGARTKPRFVSRGPTNLFKLKVAPGITIAPLTILAIAWMFVTREAQ
jgi:hypothetical protein